MISRYGRGTSQSLPDTMHPRFDCAQDRAADRVSSEADGWEDPRLSGELPDSYMPDGQTAENLACLPGVTRDEQDRFAALPQNRAERATQSGFWKKESHR